MCIEIPPLSDGSMAQGCKDLFILILKLSNMPAHNAWLCISLTSCLHVCAVSRQLYSG